jgi:peptide/nickel transport system substrate-binding protein
MRDEAAYRSVVHLQQLSRPLDRRRFLSLAAAGATLTLLTACGGDDDDDAPTATVSEPAAEGSPTAAAPEATATTATTATTASAATETTSGAADPTATPAEEATATPDSGAEIPLGGTLIYARNIDAKTLDPHFSAQFSERYALYLIFNNLVGYDTDFNIIPELAESWEISDDGIVITFSIHEDAVFHDGTPCDAEAVKWNIERVMDPEVNSPLRTQLEEAIDSAEAADATTVVLNLKQAWRPLFATLGERPGFIVSPAAVEEMGAEEFALNPVGSGPFRFVEWVTDSHIALERNDDYWDPGKPYLDRIEIRHVPDGQVQLTMIRTDEAQLIDAVNPGLLATIEGNDEVAIEELESARFAGTHFDNTKPPFDNADLRAAISFATNREEIREVIYAGTGRVATHPLGGGWAFDPSLDGEFQFYDPDLAQEHLQAAGYGGETLILTCSNTQNDQQLAQLLQAQYAAVGINVELEVVNAADAFALVKDDTTNWTTTSWAPRADPDGLLRILWHSTGFQNTTEFSDPEVDRLLDEAAAIYDTEEARAYYRQVEEIVSANADYTYHVWPSVFAVRRANVGNFVFHPDLIIRMRDFYLEPQ